MKKILSKCVCLVSWVMIESSILKELNVKCQFCCDGVDFVSVLLVLLYHCIFLLICVAL